MWLFHRCQWCGKPWIFHWPSLKFWSKDRFFYPYGQRRLDNVYEMIDQALKDGAMDDGTIAQNFIRDLTWLLDVDLPHQAENDCND